MKMVRHTRFLSEPYRLSSLGTISFAELRVANVDRLPLFKNAKGGSAHDKPDGSDWSLPEWDNAIAGEVGELCNILKKVRRGDMTLEEARPAIAKECADIVHYTDITAFQAGVDLGKACADKFNEVSKRIGVDVKLAFPSEHC